MPNFGALRKVGKGDSVQIRPHFTGDRSPYLLDDAMPFAVIMITHWQFDRTVHRRKNFRNRYCFRRSRQYVSAPDSTLGLNNSGTFDCQQNLFQIGLWKARSFGNFLYRRGLLYPMQREGQQGSGCVITSR